MTNDLVITNYERAAANAMRDLHAAIRDESEWIVMEKAKEAIAALTEIRCRAISMAFERKPLPVTSEVV